MKTFCIDIDTCAGLHTGNSRSPGKAVIAATAFLYSTLGLFAVAIAQEQRGASAESTSLDEVVVTAERHESTIQKTPMSVTAVTAGDLAAAGARNVDDALALIPGVSGVSNGPGQTTYQIRGMDPGAQRGTGATSSTVGFYVDDVPISPPAGGDFLRSIIDPNVYDLTRVEVLRGPQGTLYGSGSMGGTIKIITNIPELTATSGSAQLSTGTTDGGAASYGANGMLNLPLVSDVAALRIVAGFQEVGGWIDRIVVAPPFPHPGAGQARGDVANAPVERRFNDDNTTKMETFRASLLIKPTDNLAVTPRFLYERIKQNSPNAYDNIPCCSEVVYQPFDIHSSYMDEIKLGGITLDYQAGDVNITSISSIWKRNVTKNTDVSEGLSKLYGVPSYYATDGQGFGALSPVEYGDGKQVNQELRVSSTVGNLTWLIGGYYSKYDYSDRSVLSSPAFTAFTAYGPGFFFSDTFFNFLTKNSIKETAGFVNLTYAFSNAISLRAGARYFKYDTTFQVSSSGAASGSPVPSLSNSASSESGVSPSVTLSYEPNDDFTMYGTISKGFRPGAGNFPVITTGPIGAACAAGLAALGLARAPESYDSDTVTNFELGEKLRMLDQRITLNGAIYLLNWKDVQQPVLLGNGACQSNFVINGPKAQVKGAEMELRAALTRGLVLSAAVSYNDAKFVESNLATQISDGDRLLGTPKWQATGVVEYRHHLGAGSAFIRATQFYLDSRLNGTNPNILPSQSRTNLRLGWEVDKYSAMLSVDNVTNKRLDEGTRGTICCYIGDGYRLTSTNRPRSATLEVNARF